MSYMLVVGATSDIAKATALVYAKQGYDLYLTARNTDDLLAFAGDIRVRTQREVQVLSLDILDITTHASFYDGLAEKPAGVLLAVGYLGNQEKAEKDAEEARKIINTNFTAVACLLHVIANDFEQRKSGFIIGISSVAGDRGRKSNYMYGAAKAGFTAYLSGLRNRLYASGVHVMTVKPGFVATKMTEGMDLPEKLTAQPNEVAQDIFKAQQKGANVLYTKWMWRWVMLIIKSIPESIFKKLNL